MILRGGLAHYRLDKSLRPPLENTNLSSQILESSSGSERQAQILESTFSSGDSALRDKSVILRGGLAHYRLDKSLRPPLENTNLSSQILESTFTTPAWDSKIVELESWLSKETSADAERYPLFSKETSADAERYPLFSKETALRLFCKSRKEDKTRGLSTLRDEAIHDSSPQDESPRIHFYKGSL